MASLGKRPAPALVPERPAKLPKQDHFFTSDDDSMDLILARIKDLEASEALAKQLQDEWNQEDSRVASPPPIAGSSRIKHQHQDVIIRDSHSQQETDEAMAKRLAREWALPDDAVLSTASESASQNVSNTPKSKPSTNGTISPDEDLRQYKELFVVERNCSKCGSVLHSPRGYVVFSGQNSPPSLVYLLHIPCRICKTNHCRGCMSPTSCPVTCKGPDKNKQCNVEYCCARVRAIALFEALGGFDRQYLGEKASSAERARASAGNRRKIKTVGPGGTGYSTNDGHSNPSGGWHTGGRASGRGRGRGRGGKFTTDFGSASSNSTDLAAHWEEIVIRAFTIVTRYLPDPYSDTAQMYDIIPHQSIQSLLALSQLPELLGSLLRNDSVTDWINRSDTYHAMLRLLRRMADCELTLEVIISDGWEKSSSCGLQEWMWQEGEIQWELDDKRRIVKTAPLYAHFKKLTRQCEAFLAGVNQHMMGDHGNDEEAEEMVLKGTSLCGDIIAARDDMDRLFENLGKLNKDGSVDENKSRNAKGKGKGKDLSLETERYYALECERLAFRHVSMSEVNSKGDLVFKEFHYMDMVQSTASGTRIPKDRLHLVKELAVTATCLPPGVWARVDEIRNDVLKFMIAGPEGTPYAGGLFEFDCFIPMDYPNKPPLLNLCTTGHGSVRFNPNLYKNGKVCLSLLGTWSGPPEEQWQPRKSTLLQVLVSIQSMILIETPYFNEPGYGQANPSDPRSISYNREIRLQTVRLAMVGWMQDKYRDHLWADVIASHFKVKNKQIRKCIREWAREDKQFHEAPVPNPALYISPNARHSTTPVSKAQGHPEDLLAEYDRGIERISKWLQK